jgi:hypothetical protein
MPPRRFPQPWSVEETDPKLDRRCLTADSVFRIASMTKAVTGAAAMQLVSSAMLMGRRSPMYTSRMGATANHGKA